ncbi:MAG: methylated-DNA--[protein]-cysteine S-methyltransferase [Oscillospiraceae bacterium]|nr:methylated-DNA--[protein]-cysteine S-methyltransferase [Oscillospiraceae bacterium]
MYYKTTYQSPLGVITLASDGENLTGLWNEGQKYHGDSMFGNMIPSDTPPVFADAKRWLDRYFSGENPGLRGLPIAPAGSGFRLMVWEILCEIPYGEVVTYGAIAKRMAEKMGRQSMSAQAVGGAVGHNPISIIIPCHRVVGSGGGLTGYAGGLEMKMKLLELEGADGRTA